MPILFVLFLIPGIAYGAAAGTLKNDRDVAKMLGDSMAMMGPYVVLAFFAGQFVAWFSESNLGFLLAIEGITFLQQFDLSSYQLVIAIIMMTAVLNLFLGSASAKWTLISPVVVPLFMGLGIAPELTQAAYRVGDSSTNIIAPLNPYLVVILVFMTQWKKDAGLGSLVSLMLPYSMAFFLVWMALLLAWMAFGLPLGPGEVPMFIEPLADPLKTACRGSCWSHRRARTLRLGERAARAGRRCPSQSQPNGQPKVPAKPKRRSRSSKCPKSFGGNG